MTFMFALTFFMTFKVMVSFMVGFTMFMASKGQRVIWSRHDPRYDPEGRGDLCGRFEVVYDRKGHWVIRSHKTYLMTQRSRWPFVVGLT